MSKLYLSHWESRDVYVPNEHLKDLKSYHISCVRSLYETYNRKFKGKLITYPDGVNIVLILRAFLSAIFKDLELPVLILCKQRNAPLWNYELSKVAPVKEFGSKSKFLLNYINKESITLCSLEKIKDFQVFASTEWSIVIVENIETLVNKLPFKKINNVQFKIALANIDFMDFEDLKVFWYVLNWCNSHLFGKLIDFARFHKQHYDNLRNPYDDVWHQIEWDLPDDYLTEIQNEKNKFVKEWADVNDIDFKSSPTTRRTGVKRKFVNTNKSSNADDTLNVHKKTGKNFNLSQKVSLKKAKSTNDIDTTKLLLEDSWIEDVMKEMDIPEMKINKDKSRKIVKAKTFVYAEEYTSVKRGKYVNGLDAENIMLENSWVEDFMKEIRISQNSQNKNNSALQRSIQHPEGLTSTTTQVTQDNSILDLILKENISIVDIEETQCTLPSKTSMHELSISTVTQVTQDNSILKENSSIVEKSTQHIEETQCTPPIRSPTTPSESEDYPIIDAIIKGSPLKNAVEKYVGKKLSKIREKDDLCTSEKFYFSCEDISPKNSMENSNILTFLYGDKAAIV